MDRDVLLSLCAQNPELEARRLASESIPVGTLSGERLLDKDTLLYPCILFFYK